MKVQVKFGIHANDTGVHSVNQICISVMIYIVLFAIHCHDQFFNNILFLFQDFVQNHWKEHLRV